MAWSFAQQAPNWLVGLVGESAPRLALVLRWSFKAAVYVVDRHDQFGAKCAHKAVPDRVRYGSPTPPLHLRNESSELRILPPPARPASDLLLTIC
jgi:hypothetical protein